MQDNIPNNIFISDHIEAQIKQIVEFKQKLKEKYKPEFEEDSDNSYIHLDFEFIPKFENNRERISFNVTYDENTPEQIKNEFEAYITRHKIP